MLFESNCADLVRRLTECGLYNLYIEYITTDKWLSCRSPKKELKKYFHRFRPTESPPLRVLLVDDSKLTHKVLKHRFGMFGWTLASVYDGQQAVERFQSDKFAGIDMVLMDLSMPVMD